MPTTPYTPTDALQELRRLAATGAPHVVNLTTIDRVLAKVQASPDVVPAARLNGPAPILTDYGSHARQCNCLECQW